MTSADPHALPIMDGATRLFAIVGHPIAQVRSPRVLTEKLRARGLNDIVIPVHALPDTFDEAMRGLMGLGNLDGLIFTVPYKVRAVPYADTLLTTGRQVGAINVLRREDDGTWTGDMFDGRGMTRGLANQGDDVRGLSVLLLGAGGAGSAIACALAEAGAKSVTLYDIDAPKARALAERVGGAFPQCKVETGGPRLAGHDVLINATPIGMKDTDGLPADVGPLDGVKIVGDVIVLAKPTPLLREAQARGCHTMDGIGMHTGQADEIVDFFRPREK
ncbi:MAG: shikimate dehydrogenase [Variibacter sp.]